MQFPPRKKLPHDVPAWVDTGSLFFVTVCAAKRGVNTLCLPTIAPHLLAAARVYHAREIWYVRPSCLCRIIGTHCWRFPQGE